MARTIRGNKKNFLYKRKLRAQTTPAENKLWLQLKGKQFENLKFRRQHGIGPYIVDFYCPEKEVVIEIDGDVKVSTPSNSPLQRGRSNSNSPLQRGRSN